MFMFDITNMDNVNIRASSFFLYFMLFPLCSMNVSKPISGRNRRSRQNDEQSGHLFTHPLLLVPEIALL
jgi:hypothetical protein